MPKVKKKTYYWVKRNIFNLTAAGRNFFAAKYDKVMHCGDFNKNEVVVANKNGIRLILNKADLIKVNR